MSNDKKYIFLLLKPLKSILKYLNNPNVCNFNTLIDVHLKYYNKIDILEVLYDLSNLYNNTSNDIEKYYISRFIKYISNIQELYDMSLLDNNHIDYYYPIISNNFFNNAKQYFVEFIIQTFPIKDIKFMLISLFEQKIINNFQINNILFYNSV
jgi:hypothetical protein